MGLFDKIRFGSALRSIGKAFKWAHDGAVNHARRTNPLLRMYYDSDLGSSIEQKVEETFAASTYDTLKKFCPNWKLAQNACQSVGAWIAHKTTQVLDASKLVYQIGQGRIKPEQAYYEIAKRATAGLFAVGKVVSKIGAWSLTKVSDVLPEDTPDFIKKGVDRVARVGIGKGINKIFSDENRQRFENFTTEGLKVAHTAVRNVIRAVDTTIDIAVDVTKRGVEFIGAVAEKVGEGIVSFKNKVVDTTKTIGSTVKGVAKKLWSKVKFW